MTRPGQTPTPSLRRRVVLAALAMLVVLLVAVGVTVEFIVGTQSNRDLHDRLMATASRADALDAAGTTPHRLVAELRGGGIRVRLDAADGHTYGDTTIPADLPTGPVEPPLPPPPPPPRPAGDPGRPPPPPPPPPPPNATATAITHRLPDGGRLLLVADTTATTALLANLRVVMIIAGVGLLLVATVGLVVMVRIAMAPLSRLTAVAMDITAGDRGRRVRPDRPTTELGYAATAFDSMLDALEASEEHAQRSAEAAHRAEAATRRFLADAAHELRTPIAGIHAGAEQIVTAASQHLDEPDADAQRHRAELVLAEARRARRLVVDMLDLSRIDAGLRYDWQPCDLAQLADEECGRTEVLAPDITVTRSGASSLPVVADPDRVRQILANVLTNARRHVVSGGTIAVDAGDLCDRAIVTVTDSGPGVPVEDRERIFERLVRLDDARTRDRGGAGLGLPIARALARAMGGDLVCEPNDRGARFCLSLPLNTSPGPATMDGGDP